MNIKGLTTKARKGILGKQITDIIREGDTVKKYIAAMILDYNDQWKQADSSVIADNVEKCIIGKYPECSATFESRWSKLTEISGAKRQTVYAWLNRSRPDVKIPFLKLCKIAVALDADLADLLSK